MRVNRGFESLRAQLAAAEGLVFEPRAPASGFIEGIDPFEETACWRARLKRTFCWICADLACKGSYGRIWFRAFS